MFHLLEPQSQELSPLSKNPRRSRVLDNDPSPPPLGSNPVAVLGLSLEVELLSRWSWHLLILESRASFSVTGFLVPLPTAASPISLCGTPDDRGNRRPCWEAPLFLPRS